MLAEQIVAFHGRGIRVIGYYHTCNSEPIAAEHPEWLQRDEEGTPRDIQVCLLSPLLGEWMLPHIDEIVVNYNVDGMFFDGSVAHIICHCSSPYMCAFQALPRVTLEPDGATVVWTYDGGVLAVDVPEVAIHRVVAIEVPAHAA